MQDDAADSPVHVSGYSYKPFEGKELTSSVCASKGVSPQIRASSSLLRFVPYAIGNRVRMRTRSENQNEHVKATEVEEKRDAALLQQLGLSSCVCLELKRTKSMDHIGSSANTDEEFGEGVKNVQERIMQLKMAE